MFDEGSGCALINDPDRVPERRPVNEPRAKRPPRLQLAAQLAQHAVLTAEVDALADQRRPLTPPAALASGEPLVQPPAEQRQLELFNLAGGIHGSGLRQLPPIPLHVRNVYEILFSGFDGQDMMVAPGNPLPESAVPRIEGEVP